MLWEMFSRGMIPYVHTFLILLIVPTDYLQLHGVQQSRSNRENFGRIPCVFHDVFTFA